MYYGDLIKVLQVHIAYDTYDFSYSTPLSAQYEVANT